MTLKLSVIVPVYNVEQYLVKCLTSLKNQTFSDYEVILVDDGSRDNSAQICQEFVKQAPTKFKYFRKENGGLSDARNYGMQYATGQYLAFIDADDYVETEMFSEMLKLTQNGQKKVVECNFWWEYPKKSTIDVQMKYQDLKDYLINGRVVAWNKIYLREWIEDNQLQFPKGKLYEDQVFFFEMVSCLTNINEVAVYAKCMIHYVQRQSSISYTETTKISDIFEIYQEILDYYQVKGILSKYFAELEYRFTRNLLGNILLRKVCKIKDKQIKRHLLDEIWDNLNTWFPNWSKNKYLKQKSKQNLYLKLLNRFIYRIFYV